MDTNNNKVRKSALCQLPQSLSTYLILTVALPDVYSNIAIAFIFMVLAPKLDSLDIIYFVFHFDSSNRSQSIFKQVYTILICLDLLSAHFNVYTTC